MISTQYPNNRHLPSIWNILENALNRSPAEPWRGGPLGDGAGGDCDLAHVGAAADVRAADHGGRHRAIRRRSEQLRGSPAAEPVHSRAFHRAAQLLHAGHLRSAAAHAAAAADPAGLHLPLDGRRGEQGEPAAGRSPGMHGIFLSMPSYFVMYRNEIRLQ